VVVNYRSHPEIAEDIAHKISEDKDCGDAIAIQCDVSKEEEVISMFSKAIGHFGNVDICIANAGIQKDAPLHQMTMEQWQQVLDVNLTGQFLCAREAIRAFLKQGMRLEITKSRGKIIHMSSVHQIIPWAGHANYAASKGAIVMLMESICQEYAPSKIRCNSIAPGAIKTPINEQAWNNPDALKALNKLIPYKRIGVPEDIGRAAVWLASDDSEYVNGTTLFVDGGMTCYPGFTTNG
jgi:glucose 1-dehydrogenase